MLYPVLEILCFCGIKHKRKHTFHCLGARICHATLPDEWECRDGSLLSAGKETCPPIGEFCGASTTKGNNICKVIKHAWHYYCSFGLYSVIGGLTSTLSCISLAQLVLPPPCCQNTNAQHGDKSHFFFFSSTFWFWRRILKVWGQPGRRKYFLSSSIYHWYFCNFLAAYKVRGSRRRFIYVKEFLYICITLQNM